ncbi:MAG: FAD-binding oxidoreductase [Burkholderiaceae bacterium]|nr:FAD-binding oxidoreductase [Burkholderiaceae bacterium]
MTDTQQMQAYLTDRRKRLTGKAQAVVAPGSTEEVARIVRLCNQYAVPLVPQGGNTGLVLGSVPDLSGNAIVLSLKRMNAIRALDADNNTVTAEAGCVLDDVHAAARKANRLLPLLLPSSGQCTIGGNLSVNAGGTTVLRYGTVRKLCLGLEVVTAEGAVWDGLQTLYKDNSGYDLRDLFIGAEGTLGVITAAVLGLYPLPREQHTLLVAVDTPEAALALLARFRQHYVSSLTTFELISRHALALVATHFPSLPLPLPLRYAQYALIELSFTEPEAPNTDSLEALLQAEREKGVVRDAVVSQSPSQSRMMWQWRENISDAQALAGNNIKHDIAIPVASVPAFLAETDTLLQARFPACHIVMFGHLGDGSLHYNIGAPEGVPDEDFLAWQADINQLVYDSVYRFSGTLSAEHGIGSMKTETLARYKSPIALDLMRKIKAALDPHGIMNPGKIL